MALLKSSLILTVVVIATVTALGQERTSVTLSGTVEDPSGAVIPDAHVEAKLLCTCSQCPNDPTCSCCPAQEASTTTNSNGTFELSVIPGRYEVIVSGKHIQTTKSETRVSPGASNRMTIKVSKVPSPRVE